MAVMCPRCGQHPLRRQSSGKAAALGGVAGALFAAAASAYHCPACGKIPSEELPPEIRSRKTIISVVMILIGLGLIALVIWLLVFVFRS